MPNDEIQKGSKCVIEDVLDKDVSKNCTPVKPLAELFLSKLVKLLRNKLNLKTNIKKGFNIRLDHFIPVAIFRFIYRAIRDAKDEGVYCKLVKDRKTTANIAYEIRYTNPSSLSDHLTSLSGEAFSVSKKIGLNTVKFKVSRIDPLIIYFDMKRNKVKISAKYLILNEFMEPIFL